MGDMIRCPKCRLNHYRNDPCLIDEPHEQAQSNPADAKAHIALAMRLSGEDPENDSTTWSRRAAKGMDVFRDAIRDAIRSMGEGHITTKDACEIIDIATRGLQAFIDLDEA